MLQQVLILGIRFYQVLISPWLRPSCRFYPSCSEYAVDAIRHQGIFNGLRLTVFRLLKCHPGHPGGVDFVPGIHGDVDLSSKIDGKN